MKQNWRKLRVVGTRPTSYQYDDPERISDRMILLTGAAALILGLGAMMVLFGL